MVREEVLKMLEICKGKMVTPETKAHTRDAREVICDASKKYNPDMLVLGSHGYEALKRVVLGSVSDYFVHHVKCPVVVVQLKVTPEIEAHTGDAREVICDATKNYNPDMLVLGSHGYGALKRVVLGNVSDYCVHHVQYPIVFVKPKKSKAH